VGRVCGKLLEVLDGLPNDLVDYYKFIIERIPKSYRWETYCLLEGVCRSSGSIIVSEVPFLLACSTVSRCCQLAEAEQPIPKQAVDEIQRHLQVVSGGMVEVLPTTFTAVGRFACQDDVLNVYSQLQLLHQTVLEFIEQPQFKHVVLGSRSQITNENGYSFLTKHFLCRSRGDITPDILRSALESERSTGVSLYSFLNDSIFTLNLFGHQISITALGVAVAGRLYLLIKDALESNENVIAACKDPLFSIVLWALDQGLTDQNKVELNRFPGKTPRIDLCMMQSPFTQCPTPPPSVGKVTRPAREPASPRMPSLSIEGLGATADEDEAGGGGTVDQPCPIVPRCV